MGRAGEDAGGVREDRLAPLAEAPEAWKDWPPIFGQAFDLVTGLCAAVNEGRLVEVKRGTYGEGVRASVIVTYRMAPRPE